MATSACFEPDWRRFAFSDHVIPKQKICATARFTGFCRAVRHHGPHGRGQRHAHGRALHRGRQRRLHALCAPCADDPTSPPMWQVKAPRRWFTTSTSTNSTFTDATFELDGMPVAYLPEFSTPDPTVKHRSGFLVADIGSSSLLGLVRACAVLLFDHTRSGFHGRCRSSRRRRDNWWKANTGSVGRVAACGCREALAMTAIPPPIPPRARG